MQCPKCQAELSDGADRCFHCGHTLRSFTTPVRGSLIAGRYEVLALLGKGGMGMVYKAHDTKLEETVALKVLRPDLDPGHDLERRFRTEIRLARKVRHRNVCGIHEYGEDGGLRYIAMEFIEGVDLRRVLGEQGPLPPAEAFQTCIHVAEGLQAIHEAGIVHRDLKTANLMRDSHGVVRLMDFGIAKQVGEMAPAGATATGLIIGTPEYMSPEQARGEKVDQRSDIYALGIVAFEIFTGRVPFRGETPFATIFKHLQEPPLLEGPGAPPLPPAVVPVLRKALAKSADERYAAAAEFARAMAEARDAAGFASAAGGPATPRPGTVTLTAAPTLTGPAGEPTVAGAPQPVATVLARPHTAQPTRIAARPEPRGLPIPWLAAGAFALVVVGGLGLWALLRGRPAPPSPGASSAASSSTARSGGSLAAGSGTLLIDALPWAEVVAVRDAQGARRELGSTPFTPLALALPPGEYTVEVRNPAFPGSQSARASVRSGAVERCQLEFRRLDAAEYFRQSGL
jgi:predicted Ser/Thr protein kinase